MESPKETDKTRMTKALGVRNKCPVAKLCGGCSYAGRSYFEQAQANPSLVKDLGSLLQRHGVFDRYQDRFFKLVRRG